MSKDCKYGKRKNGSLLREKKIWVQKKIALGWSSLPEYGSILIIMEMMILLVLGDDIDKILVTDFSFLLYQVKI